jgi:hypothetical protein
VAREGKGMGALRRRLGLLVLSSGFGRIQGGRERRVRVAFDYEMVIITDKGVGNAMINTSNNTLRSVKLQSLYVVLIYNAFQAGNADKIPHC